jgi:outer membrane protein OmpA-like peptidoglycan-associated protein
VASTELGELKSYAWDFGDGSKATTQNAKHTYTAAGNYNAKCTATNTYDAAGSGSAAVSVAAAATKKTIVLRGINFDVDKATIKPEFEGVLDAGATLGRTGACRWRPYRQRRHRRVQPGPLGAARERGA